MSARTLTDLTLRTLHNHETAATQAVAACCAGSQRMVEPVTGTLAARVYPRAAELAPRATARMDALRGGEVAVARLAFECRLGAGRARAERRLNTG